MVRFGVRFCVVVRVRVSSFRDSFSVYPARTALLHPNCSVL